MEFGLTDNVLDDKINLANIFYAKGRKEKT